MAIHCFVHKLRIDLNTLIPVEESAIWPLFTLVAGVQMLNDLQQNRYLQVVLTIYLG